MTSVLFIFTLIEVLVWWLFWEAGIAFGL